MIVGGTRRHETLTRSSNDAAERRLFPSGVADITVHPFHQFYGGHTVADRLTGAEFRNGDGTGCPQPGNTESRRAGRDTPKQHLPFDGPGGRLCGTHRIPHGHGKYDHINRSPGPLPEKLEHHTGAGPGFCQVPGPSGTLRTGRIQHKRSNEVTLLYHHLELLIWDRHGDVASASR